MQGIYKIVNKVNGKYYVGSSRGIEERCDGHKKELENGTHVNPHLQSAWSKYGGENFTFNFVEEVLGGQGARLECEQVYLDEGFEKGVLYNVAQKAGGGNLGEEVNQKISEACANPSEETRKKMSKAKMGHEVTEETRLKMRKTNTGQESLIKPYPAFRNIETGEIIPAGDSLTGMCREHGLNYWVMYDLQKGKREKSRNGWRLA